MEIPISTCICIAIAIALLALPIMRALELRWARKQSFSDVLARARRVEELLPKLAELGNTQRKTVCRTIAKSIRDDCRFLLFVVGQTYFDQQPQNRVLKDLAATAVMQACRTRQIANRFLFLTWFRPLPARNCNGLAEAILQNIRMWAAYLRLLQAQYPERFGSLPAPD